jgi:hypothetical protein
MYWCGYKDLHLSPPPTPCRLVLIASTALYYDIPFLSQVVVVDLVRLEEPPVAEVEEDSGGEGEGAIKGIVLFCRKIR